MLEVLRFVFYRELKYFFLCFYPPLLYYDVSMYDLVELVIIFETSPSSLKSESGCLRYDLYRFGGLPVRLLWKGLIFPFKDLSPLVGFCCFSV